MTKSKQKPKPSASGSSAFPNKFKTVNLNRLNHQDKTLKAIEIPKPQKYPRETTQTPPGLNLYGDAT